MDDTLIQWRCPVCGDPDHLEVSAKVFVHLVQDEPDNFHTEESSYDGSHDWDSDSVMCCLSCRWVGSAGEAEVTL